MLMTMPLTEPESAVCAGYSSDGSLALGDYKGAHAAVQRLAARRPSTPGAEATTTEPYAKKASAAPRQNEARTPYAPTSRLRIAITKIDGERVDINRRPASRRR